MSYELRKRDVVALVVVVSLLVVPSAWAATWRDVLDRALTTPVGANEALWVQKVGTTYRVWVRDGELAPVGATWWQGFAIGTFQSTVVPPATGFNEAFLRCDGTFTTDNRMFTEGMTRAGYTDPWETANLSVGRDALGRPVTGGSAGAVPSAWMWADLPNCWVVSGSDSGKQAAARTADRLIQEFPAVQPGSCTWSALALIDVGTGSVKQVKTGACDCVPDGMAVVEKAGDGSCTFRTLTGDPAIQPGSSGGTPGPTPSSGVGVAPVAGTDYNPATGQGVGGTGSSGSGSGTGSGVGGSAGGGAGTPGWQWTAGSGGSGGPSVGDLAAGVKQGVREAIDEEQAEPGSGIPGDPTYDGELPEVEKESIGDLITGFLTGNPIVAAIRGTQLTATGGTCSVSFSAFGTGAALDFCWSGPYLEVIGTMLVSIASVWAVVIAWRAN